MATSEQLNIGAASSSPTPHEEKRHIASLIIHVVMGRMNPIVKSCIALFFATFAAAGAARADAIATVLIGHAGNAADTRFSSSGFGSTPYAFRIGATEVTNAQYVEFLNATAASDPYQLFNASTDSSSMRGIVRSGVEGQYTYLLKAPAVGKGFDGGDYAYGDKPVTHVSWYDAIRFVNWLHNGRGNGDTETGAYVLLGGTPIPSNATSIIRAADAQWWLPSEDEWYKAAYYDPSQAAYNLFPMVTGAPDNNVPSSDTGSSANFSDDLTSEDGYTTSDSSFPLTPVGGYSESPSPYGTFDQGGNVGEWNETFFSFSQPLRGIRGGNWSFSSVGLRASSRGSGFAADERNTVGFRVATIVPEPSGEILLLMGVLAVISLGRPGCPAPTFREIHLQGAGFLPTMKQQ